MRFRYAITVVACLLAAPAHAFDVRQIIADSRMLNARVDAEFDQHRSSEAPLYFRFALPAESDALRVQVEPLDHPGYMELAFFDPEGALAEMVMMTHAQLTDVAPDDRLSVTALLMRDRFFPRLTQGRTDVEMLNLQGLMTGGHASVELTGVYREDRAGDALIFVRMVGILPPDGEAALIVGSLINSSVQNPEGPDDLAAGFGGHIARSVQFVARRDADGAMVPF